MRWAALTYIERLSVSLARLWQRYGTRGDPANRNSQLTLCTVPQNDTCRTFLAEPLDGLQRWQMWMILITLIISQLLVTIWMFYAKSGIVLWMSRHACTFAHPHPASQ